MFVFSFLCCSFEEKAKHRDHFVHQSICLSRKFNVGYNFPIFFIYFFIKLLIYFVDNNTDIRMPNSLGQDHICQGLAPFFAHYYLVATN